MDVFVAHPQVERVLGHGDTKSSVRLAGGYQADLRLVPRESRGAAMQYFTGSKAHNIVVRDRAIQRGFKLNEYGLFKTDTDEKVAGETEEGIYEALGMAWVEPELREHRGEIEAAVAGSLPTLVTVGDLRGDLHMHTTATDGRDDLETMAAAAHRLGHQYIAITDHSQALAMANGLDEQRALEHAARVRALNGRFEGLTLLAGIECDILADGRLDLADDCLAQLDLVVASVHSHFTQDQQQMTDRVLRALESPWVDVLGHPTGRLLLKREPAQMDMAAVVAAAGTRCRDGNQLPARAARPQRRPRAAGPRPRRARSIISTDAHSVAALDHLRWGVQMARRAWVRPRTSSTRAGSTSSAARCVVTGVGEVAKTPAGFVSLKSLKQGPPDAAAALAEIRRIYFKTTRQTIDHDLAHAIELLKTLPTEDDREKATVYMDGLAEMQRNWAGKKSTRGSGKSRRSGKVEK